MRRSIPKPCSNGFSAWSSRPCPSEDRQRWPGNRSGDMTGWWSRCGGQCARGDFRTPSCSSVRKAWASIRLHANWPRRFFAKRGPKRLDPCGNMPGLRASRGGYPSRFPRGGKPEDKHELPISVIRELCDQFGVKPARGSHKVAILDDADDLNEEASNAFLKTLEEPPPGAVLILVGTTPELQKETIVSRCSVVRFDPLPDAEIAAPPGDGRRQRSGRGRSPGGDG